MTDTAFYIMFGAAVIYFLLGNYLYFAKILPTLDEAPKLLPSNQLNHVDRYLALLDEQSERPWFEPILRNARAINIVYLSGFAITIALVFLD